MKRETIYLYADENSPRVKLTCVRQISSLKELINYFHSLQDTFHLEFEIVETITENLKVTCVSYGIRDIDTFPFFIIEYDAVIDRFFIWKSDGKWDMNKIITSLYKLHSQKSNKFESSKKILESHRALQTHPMKKWILAAMNKLNVDWSQVDITEFWTQFIKIYESHKDDEAVENEFTFKGFISMSLLKTSVIQNKTSVTDVLTEYYKKMNKNHFSSELENNKYSLEPSPISSNELLTDGTSEENYTYNTQPKPSNNQVIQNFNNHFKLSAEDYEHFDIKIKSHSKPKNRISKIK